MIRKWNNLTKVREFRLKLYPRDFDRVRHFYERNLTFPVIHEWNRGQNDRGVMFSTGSATLELLSPEKEYQPIAGCSLSLEIADVWKLWQNFEGADNVIFPLRDNAWGDTSFCISDPEGLKITFFTKTDTADL